MNGQRIILGVAFCALLLACSNEFTLINDLPIIEPTPVDPEPEKECNDNEAAQCNNGLLRSCINGLWIDQQCDDGKKCTLLKGGAGCVEQSEQKGEIRCLEDEKRIQIHNAEGWQDLVNCSDGSSNKTCKAEDFCNCAHVYCSDDLASALYCSKQQWGIKQCGQKEYCQTLANSIVCALPKCVQNVVRCSKNNTIIERCDKGEWVLDETCIDSSCVQYDAFKAECNARPVTVSCSHDKQSIIRIENGFVNEIPCEDDAVCEIIDGTADCYPRNCITTSPNQTCLNMCGDDVLVSFEKCNPDRIIKNCMGLCLPVTFDEGICFSRQYISNKPQVSACSPNKTFGVEVEYTNRKLTKSYTEQCFKDEECLCTYHQEGDICTKKRNAIHAIYPKNTCFTSCLNAQMDSKCVDLELRLKHPATVTKENDNQGYVELVSGPCYFKTPTTKLAKVGFVENIESAKVTLSYPANTRAEFCKLRAFTGTPTRRYAAIVQKLILSDECPNTCAYGLLCGTENPSCQRCPVNYTCPWGDNECKEIKILSFKAKHAAMEPREHSQVEIQLNYPVYNPEYEISIENTSNGQIQALIQDPTLVFKDGISTLSFDFSVQSGVLLPGISYTLTFTAHVKGSEDTISTSILIHTPKLSISKSFHPNI
ncbi:MAG: hypothetical protein ACOX8U_05875 [Bradymonadia bacterium]|jgi:hypothetical protein